MTSDSSSQRTKHVVESEHNTGRCIRSSPMKDWRLCCEQYHHCGFKLDRSVLRDAYDGYCFTNLVWKCPRCGCENELRYKIRKGTRSGARNPGLRNGSNPFDSAQSLDPTGAGVTRNRLPEDNIPAFDPPTAAGGSDD